MSGVRCARRDCYRPPTSTVDVLLASGRAGVLETCERHAGYWDEFALLAGWTFVRGVFDLERAA